MRDSGRRRLALARSRSFARRALAPTLAGLLLTSSLALPLAFVAVDAYAQTGSSSSSTSPASQPAQQMGPALPGSEPLATEVDIEKPSIFGQAIKGGIVVFMCLLILVTLSVLSWAVVVAKWVYLTKLQRTGDGFIKSFWDSRSLNDLNSRLGEYAYSPVREVFRIGYAELVRGSQLRDQAATSEMAVHAAMDNLNRALTKARLFEKRRMERFMGFLATTASASPFIGLFGTVWGIMNAFEGIARTGSASLAAVAPGISEALIATAFGLAAAIPAVVGYNIFAGRVRGQMANIDGFAADFLNIVERYLVTDKPKGGHSPHSGPAGGAQSSPLADRI